MKKTSKSFTHLLEKVMKNPGRIAYPKKDSGCELLSLFLIPIPIEFTVNPEKLNNFNVFGKYRLIL